MSALLRVAMLTPLPPARTGTAEYAAELAAELQKIVDLRVIENARGATLKGFDAVVYQMGNNPYHAAIYQRALQEPGITVLHEGNLHDLIRGTLLSSVGESAYIREVMYEIFGHDHTDPDRGAVFEVPQPRTFTMLRRLLDSTDHCIVHSAYTERIVRQKGFTRPVAVIPHGSSAGQVDAVSMRAALRIPPGAPLIGVFGYHRPDKRESECFSAFRRVLTRHTNSHMLIAGQPHPEVPVEEWIGSARLERQVRVLGYQALQDYDRCLAACDIVLNLRRPTFGETSGTMMRAFGLGKAVIVTDAGASSELPDQICIHIPPDEFEERTIAGVIEWLLECPSRIDQIGRRAQQWVSETCAWPLVAQMYASFLKEAADSRGTGPTGICAAEAKIAPLVTRALDSDTAAAYLRRWIAPSAPSEDYFRTHRRRLARTLQLVPAGTKDARILELGCYLEITPALRNLLGYGQVRGAYLGTPGESVRGKAKSRDGEEFECLIDLFNAETDAFPYPDGYFSTVLCCELLEHLERDPMHMMAEIHRILKSEGILVLTTPNIASLRAVAQCLKGAHPASFRRYTRVKFGGEAEPGHSREYTPDEIRLLLADAGFVPLSVETGPYSDTTLDDPSWVEPILQRLKLSTELRDDCILAVARKESIARKRFPVWLYGD
jgi:SAM-dependent methyltransferase/glycosyltransferase involved in cell wall biosynthesis